MWTWRRKEADPPPAPAAAPAVLPVTRSEWRGLPPIQRVVAAHPLVNPVQRFSSSLTSWQSPGYLEPLGHRVGPEEPAGVIGDLARPRTAETPSPAMPVVQRATRKRGGLSRLWETPVQRAAEPDAPASEPPEEAAPASVQLLSEEVAPAPMPELVLPTVAASSRETPPPMSLISAGTSVVPAAPPVRTVQAIRAEEPVRLPEPAVGAPSLVDTPAASVETVLVPDPAPAEAPQPAEPARPVLPVVQRSEQAAMPASPRRLGLGAPILPDAAVPAVAAGSYDAPLAGAVEPSNLASAETPVVADPPLPVARIADGPAAAEPSTPTLATAVQRSVIETPVKDNGTPGTAGAAVPLTVAREVELPTVTSSRSSPINTFRPLDVPEFSSGTPEPPGRSGGSASASPPPAPTAPTPSLPVARVVDGQAESPQAESPQAESLPVARAADEPSVPVAGAAESPLLVTRTVDTPQSSVARAVDEPSPLVRTVTAPDLTVARALDESPLVRTAAAPELSVARALDEPSVAAPDLPVARAVHEPSQVVRTVATPELPVVRTVDTPGLTVARVMDELPSPMAPTVAAPELPVARAVDEPVVPTVAAPGLPVARLLDGPLPQAAPTTATLNSPLARVVDEPPLPVARAMDEPSLPVARTIDEPPLPVARTVDEAPMPVARATDGPLPMARTVETPSLPVSRAIDTPPLPVVRTLDAPPTVMTQAGMPTLPVARAVETSQTPSALPVAPVLTGSAPAATIQRIQGPGTPLPVAHGVDSLGSRSLPPSMPVAAIGRPSTSDFLPAVQRAVPSEGLTLNLPPVVQRQVETQIVQREAEAAPPAAQPAPAPPPEAAAPAPAPAPPPETEELVKKLFDPLLRRLKTELRLDRERRGALTDRPH